MSLAARPGQLLLGKTLDTRRVELAQAVRDRIAGPEFQAAHQQIWYTPGPRWFGEQDPIWRIHLDTAMFVGGIRALLLQSLHPVAMLGVSQHSGFRGDPWGRLQRTSRFLATTTYGTIADAERSIAIVRAIHRRVKGTTSTGRPYRADDPHLLGWIHAAQVDSFLTTYRVFGAEPLDETDADAYVRQSGFVAAKLGVVNPPQTRAELDEVLADYRPELKLSPAAKDAAAMLLKNPPLAGPQRFGYAILAAGAVSTLPTWARTTLLLPTLPATDRLVTRPLTRSALGTIRWALSGAPA
jgi:uncharacterized protein (DUF2236 family)